MKQKFKGVCFILFALLPYVINAQTPEGTWQQVSSKQFLTEAGIKSYGRSFLESPTVNGSVIYTYRPDHTYQISSKSISNPTPRLFVGIWSLTGDQLTMTSNGKSVVSKIAIQTNILTLDTAYPNSDMTTNVIVTFKKI